MKAPNKSKVVKGIEVSKVNETVLTAKLVELIGDAPIKGKALAFKIELFMDWAADRKRRAKEEGLQFGNCEFCGAGCELTWERCCVCGTGNTEEEPSPELSKIIPSEFGQELDAAVARVKMVIAGSMQSYWQIGRELLGIHDNQLYKKRVDDSMRPIYKSWDAFTEAELGLSGARASSIMLVARQFTEEEVVALGVEKLRTIARLPENKRREFIARAPAMSTRELSSAIANVGRVPAQPRVPSAPAASAASVGTTPEAVAPPTQAAGAVVGPLKASGLKQGTEAAKKAREERKAQADVNYGKSGVTASFQRGEYDLPLYEKGDDYECQEVLVNGVTISYKVVVVGKNPHMHVKVART